MVGLFLLILIAILGYLLHQREGFIGLTDSIPMPPLVKFIQHDLNSLKKGNRLLYIIYKSNGNANKLIDKKIKALKREKRYSILRIFPVTNTTVANSLFSNFYRNQINYDEITVLTNNIQTTKKNKTQLISFVNTDTPWYTDVLSIINTNNKVI
jgi:hypothetical protein